MGGANLSSGLQAGSLAVARSVWELQGAPLSLPTLTQSSSTFVCPIFWTLHVILFENRILLLKECLKLPGVALLEEAYRGGYGQSQARDGDSVVVAELRKSLRPPWYLFCISGM